MAGRPGLGGSVLASCDPFMSDNARTAALFRSVPKIFGALKL